MKLYLYISDPLEFLAGDYNYSLNISDRDDIWKDCVKVGSIDVDIDIDHKLIVEHAVDCINAAEQKELAEHSLKMDMLATQKNNLLCIEHKE